MAHVHHIGDDAVIDRRHVLAALLYLHAIPGSAPASPQRVRRNISKRFATDAQILAVQTANPTLIANVSGSLRLTPEGQRQARERPMPRTAVA